MKLLNILFLVSLANFSTMAEVSGEVEVTVGASCLTKETLEKLGFTAADSIEKVSSPTYCTDVYADPGRCITADTIKTYIEKKQDEFTVSNSGYAQLVKMFDTFFGNIGEALSDFWAKITDNQEPKTWKERMSAQIKKAQDVHDTCFKTYNQITHGVSCLLSSGKALQETTVSSDKVTIKANNSALDLVPNCMEVVGAICLYFKGGEEAKVDTKQTDDQKMLCEEHATYEKCKSEGKNDETCLTTDIKKKFFNYMYAPLANKWFPKVTDIESVTDKMLEWFKNAKDTVFSWFKSDGDSSERILESAMSIEFDFSDSGYDTYQGGSKSGVEVKDAKLFSLGSLVLIIGLYLQFK